MSTTTVIGPAICQACGEEVVYERLGDVHLGWLHADGRYTCKWRRHGKSQTAEYKRDWMRRKRAA